MYLRKVTERVARSKSSIGYDHYVAVDWSLQTMAIAHMTQRSDIPGVFERPADLNELQEYLGSLKGRTIVTIEESGSAHWLYLELIDYAERILICDPFKNKLLLHGPKTDKIDAGKLCQLLRAGLLKEVHYSASTLYELRTLVRSYRDIVRAGVRVQNQKEALAQGHRNKGKNVAFIGEVLNKNIDLYRESKGQYERRFRDLVRRNNLMRFQRELPGIGTIGAAKIMA